MNFIKQVYYSKWFPRFFFVKPDGGKDSGVTGYFLIEWKILFSIGLLKFNRGSREAYHSHAFNALTWWLSGVAGELRYDGGKRQYKRSLIPKFTPRSNVHKVVANTKGWAFTVRGSWSDTWIEVRNGNKVTLTHGRKIME
jgi:hypothetical protein